MDILPHLLPILLQAVPFLVTIVALYLILFKPMLAYLDERWAAIEGGQKDAADLEARVTARMAEYEERLAAARAEVADLRAQLRAQSMDRYNATVAAARAEAEAHINARMVEIEQEKVAARGGLNETARALAGQIADRVVGRTVAVG